MKGSSGNPAGRPPGSRNKTTLAAESMLEGKAESITAKAIELAEKGDIQAIRVCLDRFMPARRERCVQLTLRPTENPSDLPITYNEILTAIGEGKITPNEGLSLSTILTNRFQTLALAEFEKRLQNNEQMMVKVMEAVNAFHTPEGWRAILKQVDGSSAAAQAEADAEQPEATEEASEARPPEDRNTPIVGDRGWLNG